MLKNTYCRAFQSVMKIGNYCLGYKTPGVIQGPGCIRRLPREIKKQGVNNILVVCGPHISTSGMMDGFFEALDREFVAYTIFNDLQGNPTDENVEAGLAILKRNDCDGIVAFGGGSPMDCAKAIAARYANPRKSVAKMQGVLKAHRRILPFWAVPTTAGTGSETTIAAVITEAKTKHKASINDTALMPKWAVLDPELTVGLSPRTTASTGMDALCHAVEAYTNATYCTKLENQMAEEAVRLIYDNLYECYLHGDNIEARQNMQLAAFKAGRAFTRGCVGYVHACGHPLSALYGLHHGLVMSVLLPHVLRAYGSAAQAKLAALADICELPGETEEEKAEAFVAWIEDTNEKMGLPNCFAEIEDKDIPTMVKWADKEANPLYPVPEIWGKKELAALYKRLQLSTEPVKVEETVPEAAAEAPTEVPAEPEMPAAEALPDAEQTEE